MSLVDARIKELNARVSELLGFNNEFEQRAREAERAIKALTTPRPLSEYHEDMGDVLWWKFPVEEAPYVGSPNDLGYSVVVRTQSNIFTALGEAAPPVDKIHSIGVGGWSGYHTHWTPIPKVVAP